MLKKFSSLSLHPKLVAIIDALVSAVMLWWLNQMNSWWLVGAWFLFRFVFWFWLIRLVYYPPQVSRWRHFVSLVFFNVGMLGFLLFVEWQLAWWFFTFLYVSVPLVSFWLLPSSQVSIAALFKPHRRWRYVMALISVAGVFEAVGAVLVFQVSQSVNSLVWIALAAFVATAAAGWWWWEYEGGNLLRLAPLVDADFGKRTVAAAGTSNTKPFLLWLAIFFVVMAELEWVTYLLPLGFNANCLFLTWCWYNLWIMARFHFSAEGINWRKQRTAFSLSLLFFLLYFLAVVRWK